MNDVWKTIERNAYMAIAVCLMTLVVISSISYQSLVKIQRDFEWLTQSGKARLNLSYFLTSLKDAEMSQREYLLTDQEQYLEPYRYVEKGIHNYFTDLSIIATGNVGQQRKIEVLQDLVTEKLNELHELIELQKDKGPEAAKTSMFTGIGKPLMDEIQILVLGMDEDEKALLDERSKNMALRIKMDATIKTILLTIIILTAILIIPRMKNWISALKMDESKQLNLANTDELTDISNRRSFFQLLDREVFQAKISGKAFSVAMFDIDHFKNINDHYGHMAGDMILKQMGKILKENVYPLDVVARYGGDEFILLMPNTNSEKVKQAIERLRKVIDQWQWRIVGDKTISITISTGVISTDSYNLTDSEELVEKADEALYMAKEKGRNCIVQWSKDEVGPTRSESQNSQYQEMQTKVYKLKKQLHSYVFGTISSLFKAVNMAINDPYVERHNKNVRVYARALAMQMDLSEELTERIATAALLQDLGKICIPTDILKKTTSLTERERRIMKEHPIAANKILEPIGMFDLESKIIRHHHEHYDGGGYPDGLKGREIPIGSRILAVVDAYDAMTSERLHSAAKSSEEAMQEIEACKGSQFDPEIVDAFKMTVQNHNQEWPLNTTQKAVSTQLQPFSSTT